jgi:Ca2+-binding RTX toxin-like protein
LIIIGGPIRSELEGGDGNDLIIAGASADHPGNHFPGWGLDILFYWNLAPESWSNRWTDNRDGIYVLGDHLSGGIGRDTLIGNDLENELNGGAGADVMIGGAGSDFYIVDDAGDVVMEHHHGGVDVVLSSISYILSDNVEKLILAANAGDLNGAGNAQNNTLIGNEGRNVLSGGAGNDWLNGASGDDTLIGGEGQDVFYVSELGNSVIADFQVGVDKLAGVIFDLPAMRQDGADTFITWGQGEIRLIGVDMRLLGEQDFWSQADYLFGFPFGFVSN